MVDRLGLTFTVLGDQYGEWAAEWAGNDRAPHHSYTMLDATGQIAWRQDDGSSVSVDDLIEATTIGE